MRQPQEELPQGFALPRSSGSSAMRVSKSQPMMKIRRRPPSQGGCDDNSRRHRRSPWRNRRGRSASSCGPVSQLAAVGIRQSPASFPLRHDRTKLDGDERSLAATKAVNARHPCLAAEACHACLSETSARWRGACRARRGAGQLSRQCHAPEGRRPAAAVRRRVGRMARRGRGGWQGSG